MLVNRRSFLQSTATSAAAFVTGKRLLAAQDRPASDTFCKRANTDWLAQCRFGIGVHWTAQTVPRSGSPLILQKAVNAFDIDTFITAVTFAYRIEKAEQIFKLIDLDKDLKVSLKEFTNKPAEARFKQTDRNDDGKITFDEYKGKREKPEEIEETEQRYKRIDKDGDKKLTLEEFKAAQKKQAPKKPAKKEFQPKLLKSPEKK